MLDRLRAGLAHLRSQGFKKIEKRRRSALEHAAFRQKRSMLRFC